MYYYTYKIECTEGDWKGTYYFGKHVTRNLNDKYICSSKKLHNYLKKHPNGYTRTILEFFNSKNELNTAEQKLIAPCLNDTKCANIAKGGDGGDTGYWQNSNYRNTEAYKIRCKKLSIAAKKRWSNYSEAERAKICKNMSENYKPHHGGKIGRKQSDEEKRKRSISLKGRIISDETKNKMKDAWKNMSDERRKIRCERISKSLIGKKFTEAHKKSCSLAHFGIASPHKGKIGISKDNIRTYIFEEQLDDYIKLGFKKGFK